MDKNESMAQSRAVISMLTLAGIISVLITSNSIDGNALIASIIGYCAILVGIILLLGYTIASAFSINKKTTIFMICSLLILIILFTIKLFYKNTEIITSGNVPYLTTFSFLSALFILFQLLFIKSFIYSNTEIASTDSAKIYGLSLLSIILLISLFITFKYFVTDG
jgi:hypothetical protein